MMIQLQNVKRRVEIFSRINTTLFNGIRNVKSERPRKWLIEHGLSYEATGAGFNSGQMHHRKPQEFMDELLSIGFIRPNNIIGRNSKTGYLIFADFAITFPLRDVKGNIVNYYGIRIRTQTDEHSFLNEEGIYPAYPHEMTTRLFITTSVIEAATMIESRILENRDAVMCVPNGKLLPQHEEAIARLKQLKSILWIESPKVKLKKPLEGRVMPNGYVTKSKKKKL